VRELENTVMRAAIRAAGQELQQIPLQELFPDAVDPRRPEGVSGSGAVALGTYQQETRRFQKELLQRALDSMDWKIAETAAALDLTRGHVYNLIREFGLSRNR
jgi:DNA-binding NtrC family response regulator